jgi:redox-sensitive bicupin YhaK (pirin superfamily)
MQPAKTDTSLKKLLRIERSTGRHWVGDGFPVQTLFSYSNLGAAISPFLLFDYAGPLEFTPTEQRRGVGGHPHRGFETVTIVYSGEVEHRDSSGGGGKIGPGDVQWMTAASGLVHEEFHGRDFARHGGMLEMVQLWVNLPARDKMSPPRYQSISNSQIPAVNLPDKQGVVRVIAGRFDGVEGPAHTFTPVNVWDLRLDGAHELDLAVPEGYTTLLAVLKGSLRIDSGDTSSETVNAAEVARFDPEGEHIRIESAQNAVALLLSGEPIREPIVGSGPFVMNNAEEIRQAMVDYQSGKMGQVS